MKKVLFVFFVFVLFVVFGVQVQSIFSDDFGVVSNGGWSGLGEFGFVFVCGNLCLENFNVKFGLSQENELWKNNFFFNGLCFKGEVIVQDVDGNIINCFSIIVNCYDGGVLVGYKFDLCSYIVSVVCYEYDDFGFNLWQGMVLFGYGYIVLKNQCIELLFEIGFGYKCYCLVNELQDVGGVIVLVCQDIVGEGVVCGLVNYKYCFIDNIVFEDMLLFEVGLKNKYYQNDVGLLVSMIKKMVFKFGFQVCYNSDIQFGMKSIDMFIMINFVYNF